MNVHTAQSMQQEIDHLRAQCDTLSRLANAQASDLAAAKELRRDLNGTANALQQALRERDEAREALNTYILNNPAAVSLANRTHELSEAVALLRAYEIVHRGQLNDGSPNRCMCPYCDNTRALLARIDKPLDPAPGTYRVRAKGGA